MRRAGIECAIVAAELIMARNKQRMGRREVIGALGAMGAAFVLPSRAASRSGAALDCVVVPEMTEGPFFVDEKLERSDLTAGTSEPFVTRGLPLLLRIGVFQVKGGACAPLVGSQVDVWHASAEGVYYDELNGIVQRRPADLSIGELARAPAGTPHWCATKFAFASGSSRWMAATRSALEGSSTPSWAPTPVPLRPSAPPGAWRRRQRRGSLP